MHMKCKNKLQKNLTVQMKPAKSVRHTRSDRHVIEVFYLNRSYRKMFMPCVAKTFAVQIAEKSNTFGLKRMKTGARRRQFKRCRNTKKKATVCRLLKNHRISPELR
jgi:hypothetical protein